MLEEVTFSGIGPSLPYLQWQVWLSALALLITCCVILSKVFSFSVPVSSFIQRRWPGHPQGLLQSGKVA